VARPVLTPYGGILVDQLVRCCICNTSKFPTYCVVVVVARQCRNRGQVQPRFAQTRHHIGAPKLPIGHATFGHLPVEECAGSNEHDWLVEDARNPLCGVGAGRYARGIALLLAVLICAALVVKFWPVIVGIIGVIVAGYWTRRAADRHAERVEAERRRLAELVARADEQHAWVMQGDERGVYGEFSPAPV
jgi:hypothetical protein